MEPISPELVLVDPELRARIGHLPSGPVFWPRPEPPAREQQLPPSQPLLGRLLATASVTLVFLALPLLAIASDLVRQAPRLAPAQPGGSGRVQVRTHQHVFTDRVRLQERVHPLGR